MKTVCIIQARMGSARLPGKVLLPLNGHTVIEEVMARCHQIPGIDEVIVAIPDTPENDCLAQYADWRGPEHDVLKRYLGAAEYCKADIIMRITADCPHLSPELCGSVLTMFIRSNADYGNNLEPRTFPHGLDCEVFTIETLRLADREAGESEREHVTTWMRSADLKFVSIQSQFRMDGRLTLDTEDDYRVICRAFGHEPYKCLRAA